MTQPHLQGISPFFIVSNVRRALDFYRDQLGFEVRFQQPAQDPFFAIVGRDQVQLFLKCESGVAPQPNPMRHAFMRWDAYVSLSDPDSLAAEFAARGVTFSAQIEDTHDGLRGFEVRDPDGYTLFFGRPA